MIDALAGLAAALALVFAAWWAGKRKGKRDAAAKQAEAAKQQFNDTIKRAENADTSAGDSNADREWLRNRGQQ